MLQFLGLFEELPQIVLILESVTDKFVLMHDNKEAITRKKNYRLACA